MSKQLDRAREKHRELVKKHDRLHARQQEYITRLVSTQKSIITNQKEIARSQKRLDKLMAAATHTAGPTAMPVEELISAVDDKEPIWRDDDLEMFAWKG